jgi:hypothetical protein
LGQPAPLAAEDGAEYLGSDDEERPMKTPKRPGGRRTKRNPHARALGGGLFRSRIVKRRDEYRRRPKHKKPSENGDV